MALLLANFSSGVRFNLFGLQVSEQYFLCPDAFPHVTQFLTILWIEVGFE
jgi:hypothetical protein